MSVASVFIKNPVHDGLSTTPMEFRVVQEYLAKPKADADDAADADADGVSCVNCLLVNVNLGNRNILLGL